MTDVNPLKEIADPIVEALAKTVGERGSVILMISAPNGGTDSYYVRWCGPLLTAQGLREQGGKLLDSLINISPPAAVVVDPRKA